jgi:dihydropteroate synthase
MSIDNLSGVADPGRRHRPLVLGILNVTPDSFSDGGSFLETADAIRRAETLLVEGADVIDVGGESTRPGAAPVPIEVELARVLPVIEAIADRCSVSIDTRHEAVARAAVDAGAVIINDVSASLAEVAADVGAGWIAMHMQGVPETMQSDPSYRSVVDDVQEFLIGRADHARSIGVERVWIDPGFGFGKRLEHNLALLAATDRFVASGHPVVIGTSRKSMIGTLLARSDGVDAVAADDRLEGSVATACFAAAAGVDMIRVHDVGPTVAALSVVAAASGQR